METAKSKILLILKQPIIYILIICTIVQVIMYNEIPSYGTCNDTISYIEDFKENIFKGEVNAFRTPVYPYLIRVIRKIGGEENLYNNISFFQKLLFLITIILLYKCLIKITNNKLISSAMSIIFGICPFIIFWNTLILTESISLFEIALLSLLTVDFFKKPKKYLSILIRYNDFYYDNDKASIYIRVTNLFNAFRWNVFIL